MCGLSGILNLDRQPVSPVVIRRMNDSLAHRGPDGDGCYTKGCVGLGHRRLAIIDPSPAGHQPMATRDGRYVLVYNGEIYNFQELRVELESLGHRFHSSCDTEVVLNAFVEWGASCITRFNGMFALAIWDEKDRSLFLARDRYGIKPLYYARFGNHFVFASEHKAILAHPAASRDLDIEGLVEYFTFQNFLSDRTLLRGIHLFPSGCHAVIRPSEDAELEPQRYWDFDFREPATKADEEEYREELDRLFRQAVQRQLVSDVPVGAYLSGGMDSGSITALAARQLPYMTSFTCGFDLHSASGLELGFDERERAEQMSHLFKTEHYEMVLKAGDMERILPAVTWHLEEPRVGQSYPNYYVARLASKFVKVALAGTGGDELFGGYPWRYYRAAVNTDFDDYIDKYYEYWQRLIPEADMPRVFAPIWQDACGTAPREIFRSQFRATSTKLDTPQDYVNHSLYFEAKNFLHGLLVVEDKLSMAHGLETRVPFLDNDLVDFAMSVPVSLKLGNLDEVVEMNENEPGSKTRKYFMKTNDGKLLLRRTLANYIPTELTTAVKQGFSAPDASWFRGASIDYVRAVIHDDGARIYRYLDKDAVRGLVDEHLNGQRNRRLLIWSLLTFDNWIDRFLD